MTDQWTIFTSDRRVLYYLMSIVSCTLLLRCTCRGALIIQWCGVWMSSICTVLLLWVRRHFRVTWMCIKWPVYWRITFTDHVKKCSLHLTHPTLAYCWNCWSVVIVVESLCAAYYVHYMHMAALAVTDMSKMCTCCLLKALTETPRYATVCKYMSTYSTNPKPITWQSTQRVSRYVVAN